MASSPCTIDGCDGPVQARGWCQRHYGAWYRQGDPLAPPRPNHPPGSIRSLADRFWEKVDKSSDCWTWTARRSHGGYGQINVDRTKTAARAHRVSWELNVGPIPAGMNVLHRCDNPPCVRPDHLFLGTQLENIDDRHRKGRCGRGVCHGAEDAHQ